MKLFDRVEITWLDSCHQSGWRRFDQWQDEEKKDGHGLEHKTIGYFMQQDDEAVIVCQSRNVSDRFIRTVDSIMAIPIKAVISIKKI